MINFICFQEHKIRPDGRKADVARKVTVNAGSISTADGSALVRMGGTVAICGVKAVSATVHTTHALFLTYLLSLSVSSLGIGQSLSRNSWCGIPW